MSSHDLVRDYFDREADRFDAIYHGRKPLLQRVVDRLFRKVVVERFRLICALAPQEGQWSALDVGCGSGRYGIALARAGAHRVVGVDMSKTMLEIAAEQARGAGLESRCEFVLAPFLSFSDSRRFDAVVATGYFDYLEEPLPHLKKMREMCAGRIFATFPKRWEARVLVRKLRFLLAGGFVRFYDKREVVELFRATGFDVDRELALVDLGRDWVAIARVTRDEAR